jgi:hypothetical protein
LGEEEELGWEEGAERVDLLCGGGVDEWDCSLSGEEVGESGEGVGLGSGTCGAAAALEGFEEALDEGVGVLGWFGGGRCSERKEKELAYLVRTGD